jgi:hypothetical protein
MRKPFRERAAEKERLEWEATKKEMKKTKLRTCSVLFAQLALFLFLSWHGWNGSAFIFEPPVYFLLILSLLPVGALLLALVMGEAVLGAFREIRDVREKIDDFKARRGIENGQ